MHGANDLGASQNSQVPSTGCLVEFIRPKRANGSCLGVQGAASSAGGPLRGEGEAQAT